MDDANGSRPKGPKQPRKTTTNACNTCKHAKKRCDTARPCSRCFRFGIGQFCDDRGQIPVSQNVCKLALMLANLFEAFTAAIYFKFFVCSGLMQGKAIFQYKLGAVGTIA